jgi:phospholipid transport system substrate-binding protein
MKFGKIPANRRLTLVGAALCVGLVAVAPQARAAGGETAVRSLYDTLLANMRSGPSLGASGRYARIEPVVRRVFDIQFMTRLAVGPEWTNLTEAQRQQVSQAFDRYIAAIYAERFDNYSGEQLKVVGEQNRPAARSSPARSSNPTESPSTSTTRAAEWRGLQIADVYLNGTISDSRPPLGIASILRTRGINGLIAMLNTKADALSARAS